MNKHTNTKIPYLKITKRSLLNLTLFSFVCNFSGSDPNFFIPGGTNPSFFSQEIEL